MSKVEPQAELQGEPWDRSAASPRVLNLDYFRLFTRGDIALEREVFGLFLGELPLSFDAVIAAAGEPTWLAAVHKIHGSALGIGAERLALVARSAEGLAVSDLPSRERAIDALRLEIDALVGELKRLGFTHP